MADFHANRHRAAGRDLPAARLKPEIMRCNRRRNGQQGEKADWSAHGKNSFQKRTAAVTQLLFGAIVFIAATPALAHDGTGLAGGFVNGFAHPLSGLDHMLAMISVGLWGAFLGRPLNYTLPMVFPIMMAVGGGVAMAGIPLPPVELGIALSVVVLGGLIAGAVRAPLAVACAVVALFALFHGYAHGMELPSAADPVGYSLGFVAATGLLHLVGIALGFISHVPRGTLILRGLGTGVFAAGLWFLYAAIA
jgi:urease accessory protein